MGERGPKPKNKVKIKWSPDFAYAIGLLTTDGNLSPDGRHLDFTSNDIEQLNNFKKCLGIDVKIGFKISGFTGKKSPRIQFGDISFYKFLIKIGFMPRKSKVISKLKIPRQYFFDFLRGHFDGDGTFYSYWDERWKSSFMFYTVFMSASELHIKWIDSQIYNLIKIRGRITQNGNMYYLRYAKADSLKLLPKIYYSNNITYLSRKFEKIKKALKINIDHK
ncbi:MAG: Intein-containing protein [Parcubacteria group bacterium GW2011_GWD2_38_12]|nr:MAG: Intein-containing protein [Parcubacteria group bacterium GW2011_GWC2_36_17]KKQ52281.1 MAG: Intein-containing protein [Parcubacteria group bacterium GW2011_GWD2_38_12]KKQ58372.1 MAG: Intein-containing protein [Parcubacteria group bacterium GW2011_GWD1_38_16]KKQ58565.1 MAG: Intein-containing protein [Parcubacteria group bacterium GW2011_GWC1_38_17]